jgi:divalent metal cation (Fe/Co/Zn/Cd) transporter
VSALSVAWTFVSSGLAIALGLAHDSLALIVFGSVAVFDCASSTVLVVHFRAERRGQRADHLERVVLRIVSVGLVAVGLTAAWFSVEHLRDHAEADSSGSSIALAGASVVVLAVLALEKRHVGGGLPSRALAADGHLTSVGAVLAAVTLGGTVASSTFDWWWADPTAALVTGLGAIALGVNTARDAAGA